MAAFAMLVKRKYEATLARQEKLERKRNRFHPVPPQSSDSVRVWYWNQGEIPITVMYDSTKKEVWCNGSVLSTQISTVDDVKYITFAIPPSDSASNEHERIGVDTSSTGVPGDSIDAAPDSRTRCESGQQLQAVLSTMYVEKHAVYELYVDGQMIQEHSNAVANANCSKTEADKKND